MNKNPTTLAPRSRRELKKLALRHATAVLQTTNSHLISLNKIRKGSRISRILRVLFEHNKVKQLMGTNIALALVVSSFVPKIGVTNLNAANVATPQEVVSIQIDRSTAYPVGPVRVTQGYHFFHPGIDFDGITGDTINPIMKGTVAQIQYSRYAYGNAVLIEHGEGVTSLYAHLSKIDVTEGQEVDTFTKIGEMGATGRASGDHLHLEVRDEGRPINPLSVLK